MVILPFMYMEQEQILLVGEQDRYSLSVFVFFFFPYVLVSSFKTKGSIHSVRKTLNTAVRAPLLSQ